ncbi:hypothetical protein, variant 1 [Aphanomyces astaci]|uniref:dCMP deaminase n=1 Tax=Aphanomyces astaci TaxID=112090 RepID=W4H4K2_APHAT|nr:hypothetical protein, variant 1 [Aphanomyces astaci]ETV86827.1 hypothetical protein, variant 1 [Aphanomyces astaci]|eukprot:XP_009823630.1 hypothetical protein, variant 1 [Aphanomyces astaci]
MAETTPAKRKRDMEIAMNEPHDSSPTPSRSAKVHKRKDYLSWDDYFMSVAFLSSMRSKDPSTQVGACIVNAEKKIVGIGYNGFPNGCDDDVLPWARQAESPLDTKYPYVCHAEMNAILNKNATSVKGCSIYVALFPCNECAKLIIQSGITKVIYSSDKYKTEWTFVASRRLLDMANVTCIQHETKSNTLVIDFTSVQPPPTTRKHRIRQQLATGDDGGRSKLCASCQSPSDFFCEGCSTPDQVVAFCCAHLTDCYLDHLNALKHL